MASRVQTQVQDQSSILHIKGSAQRLSGIKAHQKSGQVVRKPLSDLTNVGKSLTKHASKENQSKKKASKAGVANKESKSNFLNEPVEHFHFTGTDMYYHEQKMREKDVEKVVQQVISSLKAAPVHIPWPDLYQNEVSPERQCLPERKLEWGDSPAPALSRPAEDDPFSDNENDWLPLPTPKLKQSPVTSWRRAPF
ncbi:unnamed protein product [Victoria cruziana]